MQLNKREIIILKPTSVFLSFLASQLPEVELPELSELHVNNTAYVLARPTNDEETLNEIESHFHTMFNYEIQRWLGMSAAENIDGSFLDFLCCFKFELHSHILLYERQLTQGQQLLRIKPRSVLLKWMRAVEEQNNINYVLEEVNLAHLIENASVVIKNFNQLSEIQPFLKNVYQQIFEAEMKRINHCAEEWPVIDSYQTFCRYFAVEAHTKLVHLH